MMQEVATYPVEISHIVSIFGTILGVLVGGWISNAGWVKVYEEGLMHEINNGDEYAYNIKLFIHNNSPKPRYIRNIKVNFYGNKKLLIENLPKKSEESKYPYYGYLAEDAIVGTVSLQSYASKDIILRGLIDGSDFNTLSNKSIKIKVSYECKGITMNKKCRLVVGQTFLFDDLPRSHVSRYPRGIL